MEETPTTAESVLAYLREQIPRLQQANDGWSVEIHGKGEGVTVKVSHFSRFEQRRQHHRPLQG